MPFPSLNDLAQLSDEEFLNQEINVTNPVTEPVVDPVSTPVEETLQVEETPVVVEPVVEETPQVETPTEPVQQEEVVPEVDYKAFYEKVTSTFKASGRDMSVNNPDEVTKLMQMGVDYTRKTMEIAEQRKYLLMLENNGLLDPDKLSYLIDLDKKNPDAVKRLLADSGIDPLEIDTTTPPAYVPTNHAVSDNEVQFRTELEAVLATPTGQETVDIISNTWDAQSKDILYNNPAAFSVLNQQKASGFYDQVATEVARRKMFGQIPMATPFIQAYLAVGNELEASATPSPVQASVAAPVVAPQPVAIRQPAPVTKVDNSDKLAGVSAPVGTPKSVKSKPNPYMSDEEILSFMSNR